MSKENQKELKAKKLISAYKEKEIKLGQLKFNKLKYRSNAYDSDIKKLQNEMLKDKNEIDELAYSIAAEFEKKNLI